MSVRAAPKPGAKPAGKAGTKTAAAAPAPASGSKAGLTVPLIGLTILAMAVLPTTIVLAVGMVPTVVAWIIDRDEEKYAPITVGVMNLCGVLPGLLDLWQTGHTVGRAAAMVADPYTLLWAFGAASVGWAIHMGLPPLVGLWHVWRTRARIAELEDRQKQLVAEWGKAITEREG